MGKTLLRLFKGYRELEKRREQDEAVMASMSRYIEALEGRDRERQGRIGELEAKLLEALNTMKDMRERLAGLGPDHKEEV
jgi:hypothetical protein